MTGALPEVEHGCGLSAFGLRMHGRPPRLVHLHVLRLGDGGMPWANFFQAFTPSQLVRFCSCASRQLRRVSDRSLVLVVRRDSLGEAAVWVLQAHESRGSKKLLRVKSPDSLPLTR